MEGYRNWFAYTPPAATVTFAPKLVPRLRARSRGRATPSRHHQATRNFFSPRCSGERYRPIDDADGTTEFKHPAVGYGDVVEREVSRDAEGASDEIDVDRSVGRARAVEDWSCRDGDFTERTTGAVASMQ